MSGSVSICSCKNSYGKNCEYENGHHGNAVLSRFPLDPKDSCLNITVNKLEQRGVLHCEVQPIGWERPVVVLCAHLNLFERDRIKQYEAIANYICHEIADDQPLILAGDFNDWKKMSCDKLAHDFGKNDTSFQTLSWQTVTNLPSQVANTKLRIAFMYVI